MRQKDTTKPHHRQRHWLALGAASALLAACGGGSGGSNPPDAGNDTPPPVQRATDRIEPYDPSPRIVPAAAAAHAVQGKAAAQQIATVQLPPLAQGKTALPAADKTGALPIGVARDVPATADAAAVQALLHWHVAADGTQVAALRFVSPAWLQPLMARRIGLETMDTQAACRTYNILAGEGRNVVAALLLEIPSGEMIGVSG